MREAAAARTVPFRGGGFLPRTSRLTALLAFLALLAIWQAAVSLRWVSPVFLPSPLEIGRALVDLAVSGAL